MHEGGRGGRKLPDQRYPHFRPLFDRRATFGHTNGMKVAVSIPDLVFDEGEQLARRMKTSRSDLYARALAAYVGDHAPDHVTQAINNVVHAVGTEPDGFAKAAARRALERVEW